MFTRIKYLAKAKGISMRSIERECNFSYGNLYRWDEHSPSIDAVKKVASYLEVSLDELIYGDLREVAKRLKREAKERKKAEADAKLKQDTINDADDETEIVSETI